METFLCWHPDGCGTAGTGLVADAQQYRPVGTISYGFELFSLITGLGVYDFMDAVASVIGGVLGLGLALLACSWLF